MFHLISGQDQERNDLLEQYNSISCEANLLKCQVEEQQTQTNCVKMDIFTTDSENSLFLDTIMHLERELEEVSLFQLIDLCDIHATRLPSMHGRVFSPVLISIRNCTGAIQLYTESWEYQRETFEHYTNLH